MMEFKNLTRKKIYRKVFRSLYKKIFNKKFELSVVFATPLFMMALNKKYRGKKGPADVLSFLLEKWEGEIFINSQEKNLPFLFVHGSLHLLGYDHKKIKDASSMKKLETKFLKK